MALPTSYYSHICGLYYLGPTPTNHNFYHPVPAQRTYLPRVSLSAHAQIVGTTSRTVLSQTFVNPGKDAPIPELRYTFPLYDGVSVVGFVCTINNDRVIRGQVKERDQARRTFKEAVDRGETAGLLEQLPDASDVFTTTIGNVPPGAEIKVDITYLDELKHDAEADGIRFTIPTSIAPRYGDYPGQLIHAGTVATPSSQSGIEIVVDADMPTGCNIKSVQSPSHPISVTIGNTSTAAANTDMSLQKASASLSLGSAELDKDFILHVVATNSSYPVAVLEIHPTIPNQRALMVTLVPKFNLPPSRPELVFVCDRSGSMAHNIDNLKKALHIFLKSLPLGIKFNICSFGSHHEFLFKEGSRSYDAHSLEEATKYVESFDANFGGTEMYQPLEQTFKRRYKDMELEVFLLTDGEIWNQEELFKLINKEVSGSKGNIRVFTLGIGVSASTSLIEGVARAGNGFAQTVGDNEKMNNKVIRMLKASLSPHVKDYTLEVKYDNAEAGATISDDDDFEIVERVMDSLAIDVPEEPKKSVASPSKPISLFDSSADPDVEMIDADLDQSSGGKYSHIAAVAEPKLLQAPFTIPPLYPFNRTSVYLLLSPGSLQKNPKSIVLRGTSIHGPLELEIPVTVLAEKGETIHQLAARKAVQELEEGRGWIFHAKDAKDPKGKLLKDKYPGRFSDMVEREAVRLGVGFQVGGKWCSFVAVEENGGKEEHQLSQDDANKAGGSAGHEADMMNSPASDPVRSHQMLMSASAMPATRSKLRRGYVSPGNSSAPPARQRFQRQQLQQQVMPPPPPAVAPSPSFFSRPNALHVSPPQAAMRSSHLAYGARSGRKSRAPEALDDVSSVLLCYSPAGQKKRADMNSDVNCDANFEANKHSHPRFYSYSVANEHDDMAGSPLAVRDPFEVLVSLQSFSGSWAWSSELVQVLKLDEKKLLPQLSNLQGELTGVGKSEVFVPRSDLLATALVLVYLEREMAGKKEEWEMLAEKAMDWMTWALQGTGHSVEVFVEKVKGLN